MKRFFTLFLCVGLLGFAACSDSDDPDPVPDPEPTPTPTPTPTPDDPDAPFVLTISDIATSDFVANVQVVDDTVGNWYLGVAERSVYEGICGNNHELGAQAFIDMENEYGTDWSVVDYEYIYSGNYAVSAGNYWELSASTEFIAIVFGVTAQGERNTSVVVEYVTTTAPQPSENVITFTVSNISATGAYIVAHATNDDAYYFDVLPQAQADAMTDQEIVDYYVVNLGAYLEWFLSSGDDELDSTGYLMPDTDYRVVAFGYEGGQATTEIFRSEVFRTLAAADVEFVDCTFTSAIDQLSATAANVTVTPRIETLPYCWNIFSKEVVEYYGNNGATLLEAYVNELAELYGSTPSALMSMILSQGVDAYYYTGLTPETEYYVVAAGMDELARINTEVYISEPFITPERAAITPMDPFQCTISVDNITSAGALVTVRPDDQSNTYMWLVTEKDYFDQFASDEDYLQDDLDYFAEVAASYGITLSAYLEIALAVGEDSYEFDSLDPATQYYAYAYGMNVDGTLTSGIYKQLFTTLSDGSASSLGAVRTADRVARNVSIDRPTFDAKQLLVKMEARYTAPSVSALQPLESVPSVRAAVSGKPATSAKRQLSAR